MMPKVFQIGLIAAVALSLFTITRARTGPGPTWYRKASPPCQPRGMLAPRTSLSSSTAFPYESGSTGIRGTGIWSSGMRGAPAFDGYPGVLGSPAPFITLPRCTPRSLRNGPSG